MFIIWVYFFCISLYINFDKYCQQVRTNFIILGALYNKITEGYTPKGTRIAAEQNDLCHSK